MFGSSNLDFFFYVDAFPQPGETVINSSFKTFVGGKGFNQAFYINQLDPGRTRFLTFIGADNNGEFLAKKYRQAKFSNDGDLVRIEGVESGCAFITVNKQGENTIIVNSGSNMRCTRSMLLERREAFENTDFVVSQCEIPLTVIDCGFELAKQANPEVTNILNLSPVPQSDFLFVLERVDILVLNEGELEMLCQRAALEGFKDISDRFGIGCIVCTKGADSVAVYSRDDDRVENVPVFEVSDILDTCGAGDSFLGGFVVGLMNGKSLKEAIRLGSKVASIKIQSSGAQVAIGDLKSLKI